MSKEDTFLWAQMGDLKGETETEITAAHDQALQTKYHTTKILQTQRDRKYSLCQQVGRTIGHTVSACPILAKEKYIERRGKVCAYLHFNMSKKNEVKLGSE